MAVDIFQIELGFDQCYVLKSEGVIAVDAGAPNKGRNFARGLERASIHPQDVQLIVITHGHWDHVGSAGEIKTITGAKLAMHRREVHWLEQSLAPLPPGVTLWGRIFISLHIPPAKVDVALGDDGLSLSDYGIPGRVLHTPGHSSGSVSVLLDTGEAFVGDLGSGELEITVGPRSNHRVPSSRKAVPSRGHPKSHLVISSPRLILIFGELQYLGLN
jgi:glyoxylase-like metal-dependent hydrolase (beta-lactamase superfamily II)